MSRLYIPIKKGKKINAPDFSQIKTISGDNVLKYAFVMCEYSGVIEFGNLESISGYDACRGFFQSSKNITEVRFPKLKTIIGANAFNQCFSGSDKLKTASFSSLYRIYGGATMNICFQSCIHLENVYFSAFNSQYASTNISNMMDMLYGVTGCTVHFPSNLQSVIGSHSYVTAGFGGTNTTVLFDLPETT